VAQAEPLNEAMKLHGDLRYLLVI